MKKLLIMLVCCLVLVGCGSGITKEQYEQAISERDDLQVKLDNAEKIMELKVKVAEYRAEISEEYEHIIFVLRLGEKITGTDASETISAINGLHDQAIQAIEAVESSFNGINSLMIELDTEIYESTIKTIDGVYKSWKNAYSGIKNIEDSIMGL